MKTQTQLYEQEIERLRADLMNLRNVVCVSGLGGGVSTRSLAELQVENMALRSIVATHCPHVDVKAIIPDFERTQRRLSLHLWMCP